MNLLALIPLLTSLPQTISAIESVWAATRTNNDFLGGVLKEIPIVANLVESVTGAVAPQAQASVHAGVTIILSFSRKFVSGVQTAINAAAAAGFISLPKPLDVDGYYGPKTEAAVALVQPLIGATVDGKFGKVSEGLWNAFAAKHNLPQVSL